MSDTLTSSGLTSSRAPDIIVGMTNNVYNESYESDGNEERVEDEIPNLDCEFEIIHSETDHSSLVNDINQSESGEISQPEVRTRSQSDISEPVPDLESVKSIPIPSNSVLDELETKSTTSSGANIERTERSEHRERSNPNGNDPQSGRPGSGRGRPPKRSIEFKFGSYKCSRSLRG